MTGWQIEILKRIKYEPMSPTQIGRSFGLADNASAWCVPMIKGLVNLGYVDRNRIHGSKTLYSITPAGLAELQKLELK